MIFNDLIIALINQASNHWLSLFENNVYGAGFKGKVSKI